MPEVSVGDRVVHNDSHLGSIVDVTSIGDFIVKLDGCERNVCVPASTLILLPKQETKDNTVPINKTYTKTDLKAGDKIVRVNGGSFSNGEKVATVERVVLGFTSNEQVWIKETASWLYASSVKLAEPQFRERGFIIAVEKEGRYAPNTTPREYSSQEQAEKVATEMATKHGEVFYVLKPVAKVLPPVKPQAELVKLS